MAHSKRRQAGQAIIRAPPKEVPTTSTCAGPGAAGRRPLPGLAGCRKATLKSNHPAAGLCPAPATTARPPTPTLPPHPAVSIAHTHKRAQVQQDQREEKYNSTTAGTAQKAHQSGAASSRPSTTRRNGCAGPTPSQPCRGTPRAARLRSAAQKSAVAPATSASSVGRGTRFGRPLRRARTNEEESHERLGQAPVEPGTGGQIIPTHVR